MIGRDLWDKIVNGKRNERVYLCEQDFALFAMYYFAEFFVYVIPGFQWLMYRALNGFTQGKFKFLLWVMFRESAKTTIAKIYVVYCVAYRKKRFINYDCYDKGNAEAALFDVVTWLQTNRKLIADFGQLFYEDPRQASRQAKLKRVSEFVTTNRVKLKAYSTQESTRGRIFDRFRPDLYIVDDVETETTIKSAPVTAKIIAHLDTLKTGMSSDGQVLFLGNLISDTGTIASLIAEAKENPESWRTQRTDVEESGVITWPDKYVATREEAAKLNERIANRQEWKIPLDQKKKDLNASGRKVYEAEMLNNPEASGDLFFERERVDRDIARAKARPPLKSVGGLDIHEEYQAAYRYAFGGDTSKGVGRDACASVGIRFAPSALKPAKVVATYISNTIAPDMFGDEMASHGRTFGECLLAPELNNTGFATVTRLKAIYPQHRIYLQEKTDQIGKVISKDLGWEARPGQVETIYYNFRSAYNDGQVDVLCPRLLAEMRTFTKRDLEESARRSEAVVSAGVITKHFDLLRAACIAWEMRGTAVVIKPKKAPPAQQYAPRSEYQGG